MEQVRAPVLGGRTGAWGRYLAVAATVGIVLGITMSNALILPEVMNQWGEDYGFFRDVAQRWVETGAFYNPHQLAGPYEAATAVDVLYPPIALYLFVPFVWLPAPLWWLIPIGIVAWHVIDARPAWWAYPVIALLLWFPRSESMVIWGSTGMWVAALVALALRFPVFGSWVLFKPTFAPFALVGIRHRAWWIGLGILALASVVMLPLWFDYVRAMTNNVGPWPGSVLYSLPDYVLVLIPVVAWRG